jgi:hypothetical protein
MSNYLMFAMFLLIVLGQSQLSSCPASTALNLAQGIPFLIQAL